MAAACPICMIGVAETIHTISEHTTLELYSLNKSAYRSTIVLIPATPPNSIIVFQNLNKKHKRSHSRTKSGHPKSSLAAVTIPEICNLTKDVTLSQEVERASKVPNGTS